MFKTYEKYIVRNFINKFLAISLIFLSLVIILSILEEISYFKNQTAPNNLKMTEISLNFF